MNQRRTHTAVSWSGVARMVPGLCALLLAGCHVGQQAQTFAPALHAAGVSATVTTPSQTLAGELLEVRDSALVVLGAQVMLVPIRVIRLAKFTATNLQIYQSVAMTPSDREQLRLLGRYPYGIPAEVLSNLLTSRKQTAIVVIEK